MGAGDTTPAEQGDPPRPIDQANELVEHMVGWSRVGPLVQPVGVLQVGAAGLLVGHVPGQGDDRHPAAAERIKTLMFTFDDLIKLDAGSAHAYIGH